MVYIVNTHGHFDHIIDNAVFKEKTKAKLIINKKDEPLIKEPKIAFNLVIKPSFADSYFKEGEIILLGNLSFKILETPGHTEGSICLYEEKRKIIFSGDTLFKGTYGRVDLPGSDEDKIKESLRKLSKLPKEVEVYPGHGESTTIGKELYWLIKI